MTCALCPRPPVESLHVPGFGPTDVCSKHRTRLRSLDFGWPTRHLVERREAGWVPFYEDGEPVRMGWRLPSRRTACGKPLVWLGDEECTGVRWEVTCEECLR